LDRNRLRKATLVRGFRVSWAAAIRSCGMAGGREGLPSNGRYRAPPSRLPAGRTATRWPPGGAFRPGNPPATECGPGCHSGSRKYAPSVQHPHGDGRSRGPTEWESDGGERTFTRGDTVGGQQEQRKGAPAQRRRTERSGGTDRPDWRTFRSLKLLAHLSLPPAGKLLANPPVPQVVASCCGLSASCWALSASLPPCPSAHIRHARHRASTTLQPTAPR
jgi:hypothetical protein